MIPRLAPVDPSRVEAARSAVLRSTVDGAIEELKADWNELEYRRTLRQHRRLVRATPQCGACRRFLRNPAHECPGCGYQFLAAGAGSRFGARVHELRHEHGLYITEENELYTLVGVVADPARLRTPVAGSSSMASSGVGHETEEGWRHVHMCRSCAYLVLESDVCPRGHTDVTRGWVLDCRSRAVEQPVDVEYAEAA